MEKNKDTTKVIIVSTKERLKIDVLKRNVDAIPKKRMPGTVNQKSSKPKYFIRFSLLNSIEVGLHLN